MSELLKALTDLAREGAIYLARLNQAELPLGAAKVAAVKTEAAAAESEKAPKAPRAKKETAAPTPAPASDPLGDLMGQKAAAPSNGKAAEKEWTEEESKKALMEAGQVYLKRFKAAADGFAAMRKLAAEYGCPAPQTKISDTPHANRAGLIEAIKQEIEKRDAVPA